MKRILIFAGLKFVEIIAVCGIILICYYAGLLWAYMGVFPEMDSRFDIVMGTLLSLPMLVVAVISPCLVVWCIFLGIKKGIKKNWEWADRITQRAK